MFFCWVGKQPKTIAKKRKYVDPGSSLFYKLVKSVPLLAPKHQAMVSKATRDTSVANMIGTPLDTDAGEAEKL